MSVKTWICDLQKLADPTVIVVVGNKSDLDEKRQVDRAGYSQSGCFQQRIWQLQSCTLSVPQSKFIS